MSTEIVKSERTDALHVAAIIDIAGHGIETEFWKESVGDDLSPVSAARRIILESETVPYHISKSWVLKVDGEVAGGLIGFFVPELSEIPEGFPNWFAPLLELESLSVGYWSLIGVAIYHDFRGKGLSRLLMTHAESEARKCNARGVSLVVEDTNVTAIALYNSLGFTIRDRRPWQPFADRRGPTDWLRMAREF